MEAVKVLGVVGRALCSVSCFEKQGNACTLLLPEQCQKCGEDREHLGKNDFLEHGAEECPKHHFMQAAPPGVQTARLKTMGEMEETGDFLMRI